MTIIMGFYQF